MPVSPARAAAFDILLHVEAGHRHAVDLLQGPRISRLIDADKRLATELVMGVLRWRGSLDDEIASLSGRRPDRLDRFDPEVLESLRLGVYQLRHLDGIPARAAVYESVEMVKAARKISAVGLVNAVLRKCKGKVHPGSTKYLQAARRSMPSWMLDRWTRHLGPEAADHLALASVSVPEILIRLTGGGGQDATAALQQELEREHIHTLPGKYAQRALRVTSGNVLSSAAWREGRMVIQDEASQLVGELVNAQRGEIVLDLCAAPGMKSRLIADDMQRGTMVVCDRSLRRMKTLGDLTHTARPGDVRLHKIVLDAAQPLPFSARFGRILVDAPCSGTGTLARNPEIKHRLRPQDISRLAALQAQILQHALECLAPRGRLVYSTCSLEPEENDAVAGAAIQSHPQCRRLRAAELRAEFPAFADLIGDDGAFRTRPDLHKTDGFFAVVFTRDEDARS